MKFAVFGLGNIHQFLCLEESQLQHQS